MGYSKKSISLLEVQGEDSESVANSISSVLDMFLQQYIVIALYIGVYIVINMLLSDSTIVQMIWGVLFPNSTKELTQETISAISMAWNAFAALIMYLLLLCVMAMLSVRDTKKGIATNYSGEAKVVLFLMQLLLFTGMFLCLGIFVKKDFVYVAMGLTSAMLYFGFSVSLTDIAKVESLKGFLGCFRNSYLKTGLSWVDVLFAIALDILIFVIQINAETSEKFLLWLGVSVAVVVLLLLVMDKVRQRKKDEFIDFMKKIPADKQIVLCRLGTENVLYKKIETEFAVSIPEDAAGVVKGADYLIILNTMVNKMLYLEYLGELLAEAAESTIVIDPSISSTRKKSILFTWFSISNPRPRKLTIEGYLRVIAKWSKYQSVSQ